MPRDALFVAAVLVACVIVSELLCRRTWLRHAGTAMVVIIVTAVVANLGVIPTTTTPTYDAVFGWVAPLAIFWLLLRVNLREVLQAGPALLGLFVAGAAGTVLGAVLGMALAGPETFGAFAPAMGGMFAATYTGGSANFNALALHYGVVREGPLYAGAMAVDAGLTAVWMAATLTIPRLLGRGRQQGAAVSVEPARDPDTSTVTPYDLALITAVGLATLWLANESAAALKTAGLDLPPILILSVFALILAQIRAVGSLRGTSTIAMFAVYVFLAAIGALCDVGALASLGSLGAGLIVLALVTIGCHAVFTYGAAALFRLDPVLASVASQANIGGGTTALVVARSLGRPDLTLPAVLVGAVGTALGTFAGFLVAEQLL